MNIQDSENNIILCDELLLLILKHLGKHRHSTSLICKKFYRLNCEIDKNKFNIKIKNELLDNKEIYESMVNSSRVFDTMILDTNKLSSLTNFWRLKQIFYIHGTNIKKLIWDSCKITQVEIITLLNLLPNLESLECILWKIENEYYDEPTESLNVSHLKELKISKSNEATEEFFLNHLPYNILHTLATDFDSCKILENQSNVKILNLNVEILAHSNLSNLPPLSHLSMMLRRYNSEGYQILHSLLPFQTSLSYLDLIRCEGLFDGDNESFICICNMPGLKTLKINVDSLSERTFNENFHKLGQSLIEIELESVEHDYSPLVDIIDNFSKMNFPNLKILKIEIECVSISLNRIEKFGQNFPNLKKFNLKCDKPLSLDSFLKNLKTLEAIKIDYHYNREFSKICNVYEDQIYKNIKNIELVGFNFGSEINWNETSLIKLIKMLPNLEILDIDINLPLNSKLFSNILIKLPKLKIIQSLYMVQSGDSYEKFDIEFIKRLIEATDRLQKISIEIKLKAVDMDVSLMKQMLSEEFKFNMRKYGNFVIISLSK